MRVVFDFGRPSPVLEMSAEIPSPSSVIGVEQHRHRDYLHPLLREGCRSLLRWALACEAIQSAGGAMESLSTLGIVGKGKMKSSW